MSIFIKPLFSAFFKKCLIKNQGAEKKNLYNINVMPQGKKMELQSVLNELEASGIENDLIQSDKSKKYLNITRDTGEFLAVLVKATKSMRILEIGTSNGYSTLWLASALPEDGTVKTIELSEQKAAEGRATVRGDEVSARHGTFSKTLSQVEP